MADYMSLNNAREFASYISQALHTKQDIVTSGPGISIENNKISLGAFILNMQPVIFDNTCYGKTLLIKKDNKIQLEVLLDNSGYTVIYLVSLGTYIFEIEYLPGVPAVHVEKSYTNIGENQPISLTIAPPIKADMYPFDTATDDQLVAMVNSYYLGLYDDNEIEDLRTIYLPVGAKRTLHLDHMNATYNLPDAHFGNYGDDYVFTIIGFRHDDLIEQFGEQTKALLTLNQDRILYKNTTDEEYYYNDQGNYGYPAAINGGGPINHISTYNPYISWEDSDRRKWCNDTYKEALPYYIKNLVKTVIKNTYSYTNNNGYVLKALEDKVFLLSEYEIMGTRRYRDQEGEQYEYYQEAPSRSNKKPTYNGGTPSSPSTYKYTSAYYSLRTMAYTNSFCYIYGLSYSGEPPENPIPYVASGYITDNYGIAPAFCI